MRVLTDTHTLVWALSKPEALGEAGRSVLAESMVIASVVNLWELVMKRKKPGALIADPLPWWEKYVHRAGIPALPVRSAHIRVLDGLPDIHKDPFDRILVAQALAEKASLVSKDEIMRRYDVPVIW